MDIVDELTPPCLCARVLEILLKRVMFASACLVIVILWKNKACTLCQFPTLLQSKTESETLRDETLTTSYSGTPLYSLEACKQDLKRA